MRAQLSACILGIVAQRLVPRKDQSGRLALFEILVGTIGIKALIRDAKTHQIHALMETAQKDGMVTMDKALSDLYKQDLISRQTVKNLALDKNLI